jgi:hypothetical protein
MMAKAVAPVASPLRAAMQHASGRNVEKLRPRCVAERWLVDHAVV